MTKEQEQNIEKLIRTVGSFQVKEQEHLSSITIEEKSLNQLVSHVDIESEKMLVQGLQAITPTAGFITEEGTTTKSSNKEQWIIDPLDGTTNFLFNHTLYSISIAYQVNLETVFAVVYVPALNEYFLANDKGAFLNNKQIGVSKTSTLQDSLVATGFPYYEFAEMNEYLKILEQLMRETKGIRRMGSAAIDLAYTAMGRFDAFYELNLNSWDIAGGAFLVQQAGGKVSDFKGEAGFEDGKRIIAASSEIHEQLLQIIQENGL